MITIMLVDDHPVIRKGLRTLLEGEHDFKVVGEASEGFEGVRLAESLRPQVVMTDLMMKGISGIEVVRQLTKSTPVTASIVFSVVGTDRHVLEALRAGAKGYILKESPVAEILKGIREVAAGHRFLSTAALDRTIDIFVQMADKNPSDPLSSLTTRERGVLELSVQGNTCSEIAQQLYVSRRTVEVQRASAMRKLGLKNQHDLIAYSIEKGILVLPT